MYFPAEFRKKCALLNCFLWETSSNAPVPIVVLPALCRCGCPRGGRDGCHREVGSPCSGTACGRWPSRSLLGTLWSSGHRQPWARRQEYGGSLDATHAGTSRRLKTSGKMVRFSRHFQRKPSPKRCCLVFCWVFLLHFPKLKWMRPVHRSLGGCMVGHTAWCGTH